MTRMGYMFLVESPYTKLFCTLHHLWLNILAILAILAVLAILLAILYIYGFEQLKFVNTNIDHMILSTDKVILTVCFYHSLQINELT